MSHAATVPPAASVRPAEIAARSGSNFLAGFVCLDARRRAGMTAIYAFCRVADDAVDETRDVATGRAHLQFWRDELAAANDGAPRTPVGEGLAAAMREFGLSRAPLDELLDGMAMDLEFGGIADDAELALYCSRVASAVGRACLPVLGATSPSAIAFANHLGLALQLTNIRRDLRADAEIGRVYVPRTWTTEFGVRDADLLAAADSATNGSARGIAAICERLVARAESEFAAARRHLLALPRRERRALVPARIMGAVYHELLVRLRRRGGDIGGERVRVPRATKMWLALRVWLGVAS